MCSIKQKFTVTNGVRQDGIYHITVYINDGLINSLPVGCVIQKTCNFMYVNYMFLLLQLLSGYSVL